jgi:hypothetical protein
MMCSVGMYGCTGLVRVLLLHSDFTDFDLVLSVVLISKGVVGADPLLFSYKASQAPAHGA